MLPTPPLRLGLFGLCVFSFGCSSAPEDSTGSGGIASTGGGGADAAAPDARGTGGMPRVGASGVGGASNGSSGGSGGALPATGGANAGTGGSSAPLEPLTIFVAGDSTVSTYADTPSASDQAGWGQMLAAEFGALATIDNRAVGGSTARWFSMEGRLAEILEDAEPGDYLLLQFGTNDSHPSATFTVDGVTYPRYAAAGTDFKTHLRELYVLPARAAGVVPVFVTPPPRNSAYCGKGNSLGGYAQAMRELGEAEAVPVLDLNAKVFANLSAICPAPTPEDFFFVRPDASVDGTHFQENGARHMARFVAEEVIRLDLALAPYLAP